MMQRVFRNWAITLACAALCGCAAGERSVCAGLKYTESGVGRREFVPCATAMVRQLDRAEDAVSIMADRSKPGAERNKAQRECLAATAALARQLREAGGSRKLTASWDDTRLNEFSLEAIKAKDYYTMICFYGPKLADEAGPKLTTMDSGHANARAILAEIR